MSEKNYGDTLNLPKTSFQMKANLPEREKDILKYWDDNDIYRKSVAKNKGNEPFILHDGPPYANGPLHIGHALNKILKDIIVKYKRLRGYYSPYVPGWDTHGLPIEFKVIETLGPKVKELTVPELREKCRELAEKSVEEQKEGFVRLGVLGDWDDPYLTLRPAYEAQQLKVFGELYNNGYVFKGLKPVYWSPVTETALAEAEIEYKDVPTPSIYVRMHAHKDVNDKLGIADDLWLVIWTTTPWTLPANVAISLNPEINYGVYKTDKGNLILATELAEQAFGEMGITDYELIKEFTGDILDKTTYDHPYIERNGLIICGSHVTLDAGTGCVHTAPGHGQDDYVVGTKYGLPVLSPIDGRGFLTAEAGRFEGLRYDKANEVIIEYLTGTGHILGRRDFVHSYPHDWRAKKPIIFRATEQWFIKVEGSDLREKALVALDKVEFIPAWGRNRITSMVSTRPDWCISRQRTWGVPIPVFYDDDTNEIIFNDEILDHVADLVRERGTNVWFESTAEELIGPELLAKYNLTGKKIRKDANIMDVWVDSGVSHRSVLTTRGDYLCRPATMYLEGSDQHRGWFQSSLLTSVASSGDAPYHKILTHGFVMDGKGEKMSKSKGNTISPADVIKQYGGDILRLWCASVDYREDVRISKDILKQMSEAYRRIRNTARYILGNINEFDPSKDRVAYSDMPELDKWALNKLEKLKRSVTASYEKYEFFNLFQEILYFCGTDMSAFYLDIIKDRLYTEEKTSLERRSAQTVMIEVLMALTQMISPVLSFTAEEIWGALPAVLKSTESVLLTDWYADHDEYLAPEIEAKWDKIIGVRKEVNKFLEKARQGENRIIGNSLDANVNLYTEDAELKSFLTSNKALMETVLIVSQITICDTKGDTVPCEEMPSLSVQITPAQGGKCERCWKYDTTVGEDANHPTLCHRCATVIQSIGE